MENYYNLFPTYSCKQNIINVPSNFISSQLNSLYAIKRETYCKCFS